MRVFSVFLVVVGMLYYGFWDNDQLLTFLIQRLGVSVFRIIDDTTTVGVILFFILTSMAVLISIERLSRGSRIGILSAYRAAISLFGPYLLVIALFLIRVTLWALALVIPGIIHGAYFSLAPLAVLFENKRGVEALQYSRVLVKPVWLHYLDLCFLVGVILFATCFPMLHILDYCVLLSNYNGLAWLALLLEWVSIVLASLAGIFAMVFYYCLFEYLRMNFSSTSRI